MRHVSPALEQRALATPGLLEAIEREHPTLWQELTPPNVHDEAQFAIASYLATHEDPALTLVHVWQTDDAQLDHGPWSPEAIAALEHTDGLLGGLLATLEASPDWPRTVLVVVSDHGFGPLYDKFYVNTYLERKGLLKYDKAKIRKAYAVLLMKKVQGKFLKTIGLQKAYRDMQARKLEDMV